VGAPRALPQPGQARVGGSGQRQNAVVNGGWHVLRFSWHDLTQRPDAVLADIGAALATADHRFAT